MIKFFSLLMVCLFLSLSSVQAQEEAVAEEVTQPSEQEVETSDYEERLKLSREMHDIWPIRTKVENALENISQQVPEQERARFKATMRKAIEFDSLETASIESMADVFSLDELKAMIDFYGSKEGRSVSHKISDYERSLQPVLVKMMDKALLDTKLGSQ